MKPARFKIPKGCESITTFEQIGNTLVTTFDVESEFKIGDVCVDENDGRPDYCCPSSPWWISGKCPKT